MVCTAVPAIAPTALSIIATLLQVELLINVSLCLIFQELNPFQIRLGRPER